MQNKNLPSTIYNQELFIKSLPAQYDGFFDWSFMTGTFPRGIMPMDVDGMVEMHCQFIIFETKALMAMIPDGQRYTQQALLKTGRFTVVNIWGDNADEWIMYKPDGREIAGNGKEELIKNVRAWVKYAESNFDRYGKPLNKAVA